MKFQLATDYAIRILCYLHENNNRLSTATHLSEKLGITYLYFMKLTCVLKQAGLIQSVQGCNGGYQLAKNAENATLYDVVKVIEGDIKMELQDGFIARLDSVHIRDLCPKTEKRKSAAWEYAALEV